MGIKTFFSFSIGFCLLALSGCEAVLNTDALHDRGAIDAGEPSPDDSGTKADAAAGDAGVAHDAAGSDAADTGLSDAGRADSPGDARLADSAAPDGPPDAATADGTADAPADATSDTASDAGADAAADAAADATADATVPGDGSATVDAQTPADGSIDSPSPPPAVCDAGTVSCSDNTPVACVNGQWHDSDAGACAIGCALGQCQVCAPNVGYCAIAMNDAGPTFEKCSGDGLSHQDTTCDASCFSSLGCVACVPGAVSCDWIGTLTVCQPNGTPTVQSCGAAYRCDEADGKCVTSVLATGLGVGIYQENCAVSGGNGVSCWGNDTGGWTPMAVTGTSTAIKVAQGWNNGCAVLDGGSLACWPTPTSGATDLGGFSDIVDVAFGSTSTNQVYGCALHAAGTVSCWGYGIDGELGDGKGASSSTPSTTATGITTAVQIAMPHGGGDVVCARLSGGTVSCWGGGAKTPVDLGVTGATNVVVGQYATIIVIEGTGASSTAVYSLASGTGTFSAPAAYAAIPNVAALAADSKLYVVHTNGSVDSAPLTGAKPVTVSPVLPATAGVVELGVRPGGDGSGNGCYRTSSGTVNCWGDDGTGEWGDGFSWNRPVPLQLPGIVGATQVTPLGGAEWSAAGAAVLASGQVMEWESASEGGGYEFSGVGGTMIPANAPAPHGVAARFVQTYGTLGSLVVHTNGSIDTCYYAPVAPFTSGWASNLGLNTLGISDWAAVTATGNYDMGWSPSRGVVVYAETAGVSAGIFGSAGAVPDAGSYVVVPGTTDIVGLAMPTSVTGGVHACAWKGDGSTLCWGSGDGSFGSTPAPLTFADGSPHFAMHVSVGVDTCLLDNLGDVYCGGSANSNGELGYSGAAVFALQKVSGLGSALGVSVGNGYACAWLRDTTAACWGSNAYGELGDGTFTSRATPAPVHGVTGVASVSVGFGTTCALHQDGRASCWGADEYGATGTVNAANSVPLAAAKGTLGFGP